MGEQADSRRAMLMIVSAMLIFGTIGIFRRYIPLSSELLACARGLLGGLFILAFMALGPRRPAGKIPLGTLLKLAVSGLVIAVNWILLFEAFSQTTVAIATLCYYMAPTIVVLLSPLVFREKLTLRKAVCAALAVAGMALVSGVLDEAGGQGAKAGDMRGIALGLGAAVFYALVIVMNKRIQGVDAYRKTCIQLLSAGFAMLPWLALTGAAGGFAGLDADWQTAGLVLVVGLVHTGFAYVLYFGSMNGLRAQSIALLSYIDPVSALVFSAVLLSEPLSPMGLAGACLIIGSAIASELGPEA
ncbi:MAG: EamA family transporter [Desulfovibrio sp.]|nr:EamA family transporter [Desulfovibrio sp.]